MKNRFLLAAMASVTFLMSSGCIEDSRVEGLKQEILELQRRVEQLKQQNGLNHLLANLDRTAYLTTEAKGYSTVRCDLGVLLVALETVREKDDGSEVILKIGNPLVSTIEGLKGKVDYGETDEKGIAKPETTNSKSFTLSKSMTSGAWTEVALVLEKVSPVKLGFLKIKELSHTGIRIAGLRNEVEALQMRSRLERLLSDADRTAYMRIGAEGYSTVRFDLGALTVSIDDVVEYANGSKVTLRFGNPLATTINGLRAKIEYGEVDSEGSAKEEATKTKRVSLSKSILSGAWTSVDIVLEGVPSSNLGFVRISEVTHTGIALTRQR